MADCTEILADLVRRPSVNPMGRALSGHEYLEGRVTEYLLNRLRKSWNNRRSAARFAGT